MVKKKTVKKKVKAIYLEIGCGDNKISTEDFYQNLGVKPDKVTGIDKFKLPSVDVVHDMGVLPYPFEDNSIEAAFSSHFLEHLTGDQRIDFFDEMYRILIPNGKVRFIHPYYKSARAIQDPTHKWPPICEESYYYWMKPFRETNKLSHYLGNEDTNFEISHMAYTFHDVSWLNKSEEARNFAIRHHYNVVADMIVDLVKK